jgi:hypothetical protein
MFKDGTFANRSRDYNYFPVGSRQARLPVPSAISRKVTHIDRACRDLNRYRESTLCFTFYLCTRKIHLRVISHELGLSMSYYACAEDHANRSSSTASFCTTLRAYWFCVSPKVVIMVRKTALRVLVDSLKMWVLRRRRAA